MKALTLWIFVLSLVSFSLADKEAIKSAVRNAVCKQSETAQKCMSENSMTEEEKFQEPDIINKVHEEPGNEERKRKNGCTLACILRKEGLLEGSNFNEAKFHENISKHLDDNDPEAAKLHKMIHKCAKQIKDITDECDKAFSLLVCIMEQVHIMEKHDEHNESNDSDSKEE